MLLPRLLLHTFVIYFLSDYVTANTYKDNTSSFIFGVKREGRKPHPSLTMEGLNRNKSMHKNGKLELLEEDQKRKEAEELWDVGGMGVTPETQNNTEILAQVGGKAAFTCLTHHLSDDMVTWLRRDDDQLLTVGSQVYAAETRFSVNRHNKAWQLWVKDVQQSDAGHYECQLTTHPPVTFFFTLTVTQAEAIIPGPSEVYIEEGSKLSLECDVRGAASPPVYIFWYHNHTMVNYGSLGRHHLLQVQHQNYTSSLVVTRVRLSDAGTYTCDPHLATPANVTVHVIAGKNPAAMQHGQQVEGGAVTSHPAPLQVTVAALLFLAIQTLQPYTWQGLFCNTL